MDFEQGLNEIAKKYRADGYTVIVHPGQSDLPHFAKDFKVELVCNKSEEGVLVAVKRNRAEFAGDRQMGLYAGITDTQPGWRFDFVILQGENPLVRELRGVTEPSDEKLTGLLELSEQLSRSGFIDQAVVTAWSGFEAAMRRRLRAEGEKISLGTAPRQMLNELYSDGVLSTDEFYQLDALSRVRNEIVHGFDRRGTGIEDVHFLVGVARRLIEESQVSRQAT